MKVCNFQMFNLASTIALDNNGSGITEKYQKTAAEKVQICLYIYNTNLGPRKV